MVALAVSLVLAAAGVRFYLPPAGKESTASAELGVTRSPAEQQLVEQLEEIVEDESEEYEEVLGLRVRKDRNCTLSAISVPDESGNPSWAYRCEPDNPPEVHRYANEDIETLREWAYNDSEAAEILGIKLIEAGEEEEGLAFIYRAVALESGRSFNAMSRAHNSFYGGIDYAEPPDYVLKPHMDQMSQSYVFDRVRSILTGRDLTVYIRRNMTRYGFEDFARLDAEAAQVVAEMARIEREVVGANTIGDL